MTTLLLLAQTTTAIAPATSATTAASQSSAESSPIIYIWYALALLFLLAGALFSGAEIGLYSLSKVRLRLRTSKKQPNALLLADWLERPTYALEGLLILQNVAGFLFSAAVTQILFQYGYSELAQAIISILLVTPLILIFADILPKDLFNAHADRWIYPLVPLFKVFFKLITWIPLLPIINALSTASAYLFGSQKPQKEIVAPQMEILSLFQESAATGVLTNTQQDLVQRALRLARITVREVMIPWSRVVGVPANISYEGFRALVRRYNVSRMPVLGRSTSEVLGMIDVLDALTPAENPTTDFKLAAHLHPTVTLIAEQSVRSAITLMQRARQTAAIVVDRQSRAIGLVTMKDLIEELVGDLENW